MAETENILTIFTQENRTVQFKTEASRHLRTAISAFERFMPASDTKEHVLNFRSLPFWWDR